MTTADELRARIEAGLRVAHLSRNAERPEGLTASSIGGCSMYAGRTLLQMPERSRPGDFWRALRGHYIHEGLADDLALCDPEFTDGRDGRFTWDPGGGFPPITGAADFALGKVIIEAKTRSRDECRWHADHGPDPQHCIQVAQGAHALGYDEAAVLYLPTDAGWEEAVVCMVDIPAALREAAHWLDRVDVRADYDRMVSRGIPPERARERALADLPREPHVYWCRMFCGHFSDCRGDYVPSPALYIQDPVLRAAAQEADHWREIRLDAGRREKAAKARLEEARVQGRVETPPDEPDIKVDRRPVEPKPGRRGHTKIVVEREKPVKAG